LSVLVTLALCAGLALYWHSRRKTLAWHFQAGVEAFTQKDLDRVRVAAEVFEGVDGYEPHLRTFEGMILLHQGRLFDAIETFGGARDHPDTRALAYALSGEALYKAGVFRDAQRILTTAVRLDPSYIDARRWLAALYYDVGAMTDALHELRVIAEAAPEDPRAHRLMGLINKDFERYGEAIRDYRESLRRDPDQPDKEEILVELAECLVQERRHAEALEALAPCPRSAKTLALEADCRYGQGDAEAAHKLVGEALALAPGHLAALDLKATLELEADDVASAAATLREAVEHHPKDYAVRYRLARAYQRLGERERAEQELEAMKELRALRDRFTELHDEAMADPADAETRYQLGVVAGQLNKPELAWMWFRMALSLDPEHAAARQALEAMVAQPGQSPEGPGDEPGRPGR
jgi:tetratricopeptide (TPR) repeat protein